MPFPKIELFGNRYFKQALFAVGCITLAIFAQSCNNSDTSAHSKIKTIGGSSTICQGTAVIFDASNSNYDEISWSLDGGPVNDGTCNGKDSCSVETSSLSIGSHKISVRVKMNSSGMFGEAVGMKKQSRDSSSESFTVSDCDGTSTCTIGSVLSHGRMNFALNGTECLSMNLTDDAVCRNSDTASCQTFTTASNTTCSGSGISLRLPTDSEVATMKSIGSNFCTDTAGECATSGSDFPSYYAVANSGYDFVDHNGGLIATGTDLGSVRCVHVIDISQ